MLTRSGAGAAHRGSRRRPRHRPRGSRSRGRHPDISGSAWATEAGTAGSRAFLRVRVSLFGHFQPSPANGRRARDPRRCRRFFRLAAPARSGSAFPAARRGGHVCAKIRGALNLNLHLHSIARRAVRPRRRGLKCPAAGTHHRGRWRTTTDRRPATDRLAAASEDRGNYLDPDLAALCEALWSRNARRERGHPAAAGITAADAEHGLRGKPRCASRPPSRHGGLAAVQFVPACDREALRDSVAATDCVLPLPGERLGRRPDGKVTYRPVPPACPRTGGAARAGCHPSDPRAARLSGDWRRWFRSPYTHQVCATTGIFANRSRFRRLPPPSSRYAEETRPHQHPNAGAAATGDCRTTDAATTAQGMPAPPASGWSEPPPPPRLDADTLGRNCPPRAADRRWRVPAARPRHRPCPWLSSRFSPIPRSSEDPGPPGALTRAPALAPARSSGRVLRFAPVTDREQPRNGR